MFNAPYYSTILLSPWLYARFGRKQLLIGAMLAFTLTSFILAFVTDFTAVLALRFVQGAALGCVFVPAGLLLFTSFPLNALALGIPWFAMLALSGGALGPLVGGYFSESFGSGAIYVPSAIAMLIALSLVWTHAPDVDRPQPQYRFDATGIALSLVMFGAMQYLANEGERRNWFDDPSVTFAAVLFVAAGVAFVLWEFVVTRHPHANLRLFEKYRNLTIGALVNVVLGAVGYSALLFTSYLEFATQATATLAGAMVAVRLITYAGGIAAAFLLVSRRIVDVGPLMNRQYLFIAVTSLGERLFEHASDISVHCCPPLSLG